MAFFNDILEKPETVKKPTGLFSDILGSQDFRIAQTTPQAAIPTDIGKARLPFGKEEKEMPGGKIPALGVSLVGGILEAIPKVGVYMLAESKKRGFLEKGEVVKTGYETKPEPLDLSFLDIGKRLGFDNNKIQDRGTAFMEDFTKRQQVNPNDFSEKTFYKNFAISYGKEVILPILDVFVAGSVAKSLFKVALKATTKDPLTQFAIKEMRLQPTEIDDPEVIRYAFNRQWETIVGRGGTKEELNNLGRATEHLLNKIYAGEEIQGLNKLGEIVQKTARAFLSDMSLVTNRLPMGLSIEDVSKQLPAKIEEAGKLMEQIKQAGGDIQKAQGIFSELGKATSISGIESLFGQLEGMIPKEAGVSKIIPKELESLATEARKYKSAEEFIQKLQDDPGIVTGKMNNDERLALRESFNAGTESFIKQETEKFGDSAIVSTGIGKEKIKQNAKKAYLTDFYNQAISKTKTPTIKISIIPQVDRLIAENKIRVVSRDGRDVYMYKVDDEWKMAQNEMQAIERATKEPKVEIFNPELENLTMNVAIAKDTLEQMPGKKLIKYVSKTTGQLPEVTGKDTMKSLTGGGKIVKNSEFGKKGDQIVQEILGYENSPSVTDAQMAIDDYLKEKKNLDEAKKKIREIRNELKTEEQPISLVEPKKAPLIAKSEGEVRSIEEQVEQALNAVDEPYRDQVSSLPEIIRQTSTNVKEKVNILDYLRTPEKVLEKIGFAKEAKIIRRGYEAYLKELPKNINKISEWVKQVPKESSERIFRYLDGKAIDLAETERKVAIEIKIWLKQWAERLKLPEDNRITNYITHIFDRELIAKEFDEELAKIIIDKLPGEIYDPFLLKRLGAKGYKQDVWMALDAYVKRATRKVNMDDALQKLKSKAGSSLEMSNIEASQFKYIQRYVSHINMRPTELDNLLDNAIKNIVGYKFGQRPLTYLTKLARQMTFRGMLGFNMTSALRNISQGINTYAVLGEKYTILGYAKLFQGGALKELEEQGILNIGFIQDQILSSTKKTIEKTDEALFFFFDTAEKINRGSAYFGAKTKALNQGKTLDQAIEYAKEIVRKTQFSFGSIDIPVALQSDIAKTLSQFQTYTIKQIEFLGEMAKDKNFIGLLRYVISGLIFTYTIGSVFGMKPEQLIPNFRFDIPPSLKLPVETIKAILGTPDKYGRERDISKKIDDVLKSLVGLIPAGTQSKKTFEGARAIQQGGSFDKSGRLQFRQGQSTPEEIQSLIFGKYASKEAQKYFNKKGGANNTGDIGGIKFNFGGQEMQGITPIKFNFGNL